MLFVSNQKTFEEVRLNNVFMYDAGFHLDLESNNADCGDLIDLMKPEREPSTILFLATGPVKDKGFEGPPLCLANIDLDMPWLGEPFCIPGKETSGKPWRKPWKIEGNFV